MTIKSLHPPQSDKLLHREFDGLNGLSIALSRARSILVVVVHETGVHVVMV